jgi:hypothetical protein
VLPSIMVDTSVSCHLRAPEISVSAVFCYIPFGSRSEFFGTEDGMLVSVDALQNPKETIFVLLFFFEFDIFNVPHHAGMSRRHVPPVIMQS